MVNSTVSLLSGKPRVAGPPRDASNCLMERELEKQRAETRRIKNQLATVRKEREELVRAREEGEHVKAGEAEAARARRLLSSEALPPPAGEMTEKGRRRRKSSKAVTMTTLKSGSQGEQHDVGKEQQEQEDDQDGGPLRLDDGSGSGSSVGGGSSSSKRWFSVARAGMAEAEGWTTADKGGNRQQKLAAIRRRKELNVKSNVVLGDDVVIDYETELHRGEKLAAGNINVQQMKANRVAQRERKAANTRTNYTLGHHPTEYIRTSTLPDPSGRMEEYRGVLDPNLAKVLRASELTSMYVESDAQRVGRLISTNQADLKNWTHLMDPTERDQTRVRARQLKKELTSTHVPMAEKGGGGGGDSNMTTDYRDSYQYNYETYPGAKRLPVIDINKPRSTQLPWTYKGDKYSFMSVAKSQDAESSSWDAGGLFERQRGYLKRFKEKDKGGGGDRGGEKGVMLLGNDPDYL